MKLLFIGDVVAGAGCDYLLEHLPPLRKKYQVDVCIANGENSADGNGILPSSANALFSSGVDVITGGNHTLRRYEIFEMLEEKNGILRPHNLHHSAPGTGLFVLDKMRYQVAVVSLMGRVYMDAVGNPFDAMDELLATLETPIVIVDFHAEATAEKLALGRYLDGRVTAVLGTHTHVPTADAQIFPGGTGYITDVGMCGSADSILGVRAESAIKRLRTGMPVRFDTDKEHYHLNAVLLEIDTKFGKVTNISRIIA